MNPRVRVFPGFPAHGFLLLLAGTLRAASPVWPPPPAPARIAYVASLHGPADVGQKPSLFSRVSGWVSGNSSSLPNLVKPFGLALDASDNLCITDTGSRTVCYCDFAHKHWRSWVAAGKTRFVSPVAVARKDRIFYVADSGLGKVLAFRDNGGLVFEIAAPLQRPVALALVDDKIYVADSQAHSIFGFTLRGQFLFKFGQRGIGEGEFNFPTHLGGDAEGRLYVTDSLNARVEIFDRSGSFLRV